MEFPYFTLCANGCTCRRCSGGRRWCAITTIAPDEAGLQGIFLSHRPLVGFGDDLLGRLGSLEPGIVQLEVSSSLAICSSMALLYAAVGMMIRSPSSVIRILGPCSGISVSYPLAGSAAHSGFRVSRRSRMSASFSPSGHPWAAATAAARAAWMLVSQVTR